MPQNKHYSALNYEMETYDCKKLVSRTTAGAPEVSYRSLKAQRTGAGQMSLVRYLGAGQLGVVGPGMAFVCRQWPLD